MRFFLFAVAAFAASVLAAPSAHYVVHEKRSLVPTGWQKGERLSSTHILPMRIALTQSNLDKMDGYLYEVSHPTSDKYGKHWTAKQVAETFAPKNETVKAVMEWLQASGIHVERVSRSQSLGWLNFDATVEEAETLLKTKYYTYSHTDTGTPQVACEEYHLPSHIVKHVDFITPTVHFDARVNRPPPSEPEDEMHVEKRNYKPGEAHKVGLPGSGSLPKKGLTLSFIQNIISELKQCNEYIVPICLRALYLIPPVLTNIQKDPYGIVEYSPQAYLQEDLDLFFANYSKNQVQRTPKLVPISGGVVQTENQSFGFNGESDLDLEYAMTLSNPIPITLYQVGDPYFSGSFNTFLDGLDASYCTFEGGDDPSQDPQYPNLVFAGGYTGPNQVTKPFDCGVWLGKLIFHSAVVLQLPRSYRPHTVITRQT